MYVAASGVLRTPEAVFGMLLRNGKGDMNDAAFRQRLVDTFIAKIEVRNGEALIFHNIKKWTALESSSAVRMRNF